MSEQRRYVRMSTVFPVEFEILTGNGDKGSWGVLQGFTRDVSDGGMCIELKVFGRDHEEALKLPVPGSGSRSVFLELTINPTFSIHPIKATAAVIWVRKETETSARSSKYCIGVAYHAIDAKARKRLIGHAKRSVWAPRLASFMGAVLILSLLGLWTHDQKLILENRRLITQLQSSVEKKSQVAYELRGMDERKKYLNAELGSAYARIEKMQKSLEVLNKENVALNEQSTALSSEYMNQRTQYLTQLEQSRTQQQKIRLELDRLKQGQENLQETYRRLEEEGKPQSSAVLKQMFQWLKSHQNLRTGLVASFEGDQELEDAAFTYDQALAAQVFLLFGETPNAARILSFYEKRAQREEGVFYNAYDTMGGNPLESTVHVGPNIWLGVAALQYGYQTKDARFLPLAKEIGDWAVQFQDAEGGLRGGPKFTWYSTEHNMDAYAFFGLLYGATHEKKYFEAQGRLLNWMKKYAYSVKENRMNRGKGDATIATDTFSWSIAAIGPSRLKEIKFDPEGILDFAEKNCLVTVDFLRPGGKTARTKGFDFAKAQHLGRGGVISTEWTAQMVVSYEVMARYLGSIGDMEKAAVYLHKANFYLNELQKMVITSPSRTGQGRGCMPYASADNVDTGHGWRTPKGATTGSVAGTAYSLFAWKGYNPFEYNSR